MLKLRLRTFHSIKSDEIFSENVNINFSFHYSKKICIFLILSIEMNAKNVASMDINCHNNFLHLRVTIYLLRYLQAKKEDSSLKGHRKFRLCIFFCVKYNFAFYVFSIRMVLNLGCLKLNHKFVAKQIVLVRMLIFLSFAIFRKFFSVIKLLFLTVCTNFSSFLSLFLISFRLNPFYKN